MLQIEDSPVTTEGKSLSQEDVAERIVKLRSLVQSDDNVQKLRQDDIYLLRFLYCCDFDVEAAFKRMQEYYDYLLSYPEWFSSDSPYHYKDLVEQEVRVLSPYKDRGGRPIYICKIGNINASKTSLREMVCLDQIWLELVMDDVNTLAKGLCCIVDLQGYSWKIFSWLTPNNLRISSKLLDLYPLKEYKIHVVNTSILVNASIKLLWPFLSQRIKDMVIFHFDDWQSLHKDVSPEVLPPEYRGTGYIDKEKSFEYLFSQSCEIQDKLKHHMLKTE